MKEFFSKKWVFLSSIIASAVFVIGLLIMVCVPQFYIGSYKATAVEDGVEMTGTYKFKSSNKIVISMQYDGESEEDVEKLRKLIEEAHLPENVYEKAKAEAEAIKAFHW